MAVSSPLRPDRLAGLRTGIPITPPLSADHAPGPKTPGKAGGKCRLPTDSVLTLRHLQETVAIPARKRVQDIDMAAGP